MYFIAIPRSFKLLNHMNLDITTNKNPYSRKNEV